MAQNFTILELNLIVNIYLIQFLKSLGSLSLYLHKIRNAKTFYQGNLIDPRRIQRKITMNEVMNTNLEQKEAPTSEFP